MAAEEVKPLPAFTQVNHSRLLRMQLQPQPGQHHAGKLTGLPGLSLAAARNDEIVRIADERAVSAVSERSVQGVQIDVREQRGDHPALRSPGHRTPELALIHHPCLEPLADQLDHPSVRDPLSDHRQQPVVVDLPEIVPNVGFENEGMPGDERPAEHLLRVRRRPTRPKPERDRQEVGLENGLKHDPRGLLNHPVLHGRDAQRPNTTLRLRDRDPPDRQRAIATLTKLDLDFAQKAINPELLNRFQGPPIDPGSPLVLPHTPPRLPQNVTPVDPIKQGVKTPIRRPLGGHP
jgi:hypothetical protein